MRKVPSSTREQLLEMLKIEKRLTVTEMAQRLQITEMAVRRHLNTLERDEFVKASLVRQAMGRPTKVYSLTESGEELFPRNYRALMLDLLEDIEEIGGEQMLLELFQRRQKRLQESYKSKLEGKSFKEKLEKLADIQAANGYMPEVKQEDEHTYRFIEHNCPIAQVADKYKNACQCELNLFRDLLDTDKVTRSACMGSGDDVCDYIIRKDA
ncbi:transcriptional regulator [Bacillus tianshenii]|nr:transcriptional regulator [Bacillus tianshenii]